MASCGGGSATSASATRLVRSASCCATRCETPRCRAEAAGTDLLARPLQRRTGVEAEEEGIKPEPHREQHQEPERGARAVSPPVASFLMPAVRACSPEYEQFCGGQFDKTTSLPLPARPGTLVDPFPVMLDLLDHDPPERMERSAHRRGDDGHRR